VSSLAFPAATTASPRNRHLLGPPLSLGLIVGLTQQVIRVIPEANQDNGFLGDRFNPMNNGLRIPKSIPQTERSKINSVVSGVCIQMDIDQAVL